MVDKVNVKIYKVGSRHTINLPAEFVRDSAFPFQPNQKLLASIDNNQIIIEKPRKEKVKK